MFRKRFFDVHLYFEVIRREKRPTGTFLTGLICLIIAVGGRMVLLNEFEKFFGSLAPWLTFVTLATALVSFYAYSRYQTIPDLVHGCIPHFERPVIIYDDEDELFDNYRVIYKDDPEYSASELVSKRNNEGTLKYEFRPSIADRHSERKEY